MSATRAHSVQNKNRRRDEDRASGSFLAAYCRLPTAYCLKFAVETLPAKRGKSSASDTASCCCAADHLLRVLMIDWTLRQVRARDYQVYRYSPLTHAPGNCQPDLFCYRSRSTLRRHDCVTEFLTPADSRFRCHPFRLSREEIIQALVPDASAHCLACSARRRSICRRHRTWSPVARTARCSGKLALTDHHRRPNPWAQN